MQIELWRSPDVEDLYLVLCSIELGSCDINGLMRRVKRDNLDGFNAGATENIQEEDQKKLEVIPNRIMKTTLCCTGQLNCVASEEDDEPYMCTSVTDSKAYSGAYAAIIDHLDGSSNIDSGLPTGTTFGIYKSPKYSVIDPQDPMPIVKQKRAE